MFRRDARENEKIQYSNVLDFQGKTPVWTPVCEVDFESASSTIPTHRHYRFIILHARAKNKPELQFLALLALHPFVEVLTKKR